MILASTSMGGLPKTVVNDMPTKRYIKAVVSGEFYVETGEKGVITKIYTDDEKDAAKSLTGDAAYKIKVLYYLDIPEFKSQVRTNPMTRTTVGDRSNLKKMFVSAGIDPTKAKDTWDLVGKEVEVLLEAKLGQKGQKYYKVKDFGVPEGVAWEE